MKADAYTRTLDTTRTTPGTEAAPAVRKRSRRAVFLTWLRKTHLYVGLWGAVLGLLFGVTGFLLNHRAIMKIPVEKTVQTTVQVTLPERSFARPEELSAWLQQELNFVPASPAVVKPCFPGAEETTESHTTRFA